MDLVSLAVLSYFGAALAGGLIGFLVGKVSRFETGLAVGLLVLGAVALYFSIRCYDEYRAFAHAGANGLWGEVIAIEDVPANENGSVTTPAPLVRFTGPDEVVYTVQGPSGGSAKVGEHVNVIFDGEHPERSRIGQIAELRGGAIAMLLFGTFPASFGVWLLLVYARSAHTRAQRAPGRGPTPGALASMRRVAPLFHLGMVGAIVWIGVGRGDLVQRFTEGFAAIALVLGCYAGWGATAGKLDSATSLGMLVLGLNFGVWALALHLLA